MNKKILPRKEQKTNIILRDYQKSMISAQKEALSLHKNTVLVAATGAGKTIVIANIIVDFLSENPDAKILVFQHLREIFFQNLEKCIEVCQDLKGRITTVYGKTKDSSGQIVFCMIQTAQRRNNLKLLNRFDLVIVDEAHHVGSPGYIRILHHLKSKNPDILRLGVTATPIRGDKKGLAPWFDNICMEISIPSLIDAGYLVPPRTMVIDAGIQEELITLDQDQDTSLTEKGLKSAHLFESRVVSQSIVSKWIELAASRKTVFFGQTIAHANQVRDAFLNKGIKAECVDYTLDKNIRDSILSDFKKDPDFHVLCNVMMLTEGYDFPEVSCIMIGRNKSFKSTFIQMIGRGLRLHPSKKDCLVLDFGTSSILHGSLEQNIEESFISQEKEYDSSLENIDKNADVYSDKSINLIEDFDMVDFDLLEQKKKFALFSKTSKFSWIEIKKDFIFVCSGFDISGFIIRVEKYIYISVLSHNKKKLDPLNIHIHNNSFDAFFYLSTEKLDKDPNPPPKKNETWMDLPVTQAQQDELNKCGNLQSMGFIRPQSRYEASCFIAFAYKFDSLRDIILGNILKVK